MNSSALFYPLTFAQYQIAELVFGIVAGLDIVDFPAEDGGDVDQALAVPYLPGMDAIVVTEARLVLRSVPKDLDIENYSVTDCSEGGVFVSLSAAGRLRKVEISYQYAPPPGALTTRLVVRSVTKNGALQAGTPLFADRNFGKPGPMFNVTLGGMTVTDYGDNRRLLTLPSVLGSAWLIQVASGDEVAKLTPVAVKPSINRVVLDAAPRNLSVVLDPDAQALMLWKNPGVFLREAGDQEISFAPLAQKHLSAALQAAESTTLAALPVPLRFHSDCGAAVEIVSKALLAEYQVQPFGDAAKAFELRGDFTAFTLNAPAALTPSKSALRLTVKLLGRELNAASPEPQFERPSSGLRVGLEHWIAAASAVAPRTSEANGSVVQIASVRIYLASIESGEIVLELRSDVANSPGTIVAAPLVKSIDAGFCGWFEFELPTPLKVVAGNAPIWLALRTNKGEVRWFAASSSDSMDGDTNSAAASTRVSTDRGATWGAPNLQLNMPRFLLAQLFHQVDDPIAVPIIRIQRGATILQNNLLINAQAKAPREYAVEVATLPATVHSTLGAHGGQGRVDSEFLLFSRSVIDLVVETLTLSYDPFAASSSAITTS